MIEVQKKFFENMSDFNCMRNPVKIAFTAELKAGNIWSVLTTIQFRNFCLPVLL